jgi:hypothetical protein
MDHFGVALGAITATVIGGALLLDHTIKPSERTASQSPPAAVTGSETSPPATVASANAGREREVRIADARTAADEASSRSAVSVPPPATSAGKVKSTAKTIASKSNASPPNGGMDLRSAPSTTVNTDAQNSTDTAPSTSTPSPSTSPTPPDKPSEDQPPSKGPDA